MIRLLVKCPASVLSDKIDEDTPINIRPKTVHSK